MAEKEPKGIELLWKTEDWLAVWVGFLIIVALLAGVAMKMPKFKWTTDGEFAGYVSKLAESKAVDKIEAAAAEKNEKAVQADAARSRQRLRREPESHRRGGQEARKTAAGPSKAAKAAQRRPKRQLKA